MSLQVFLQAQISGTEEFLAAQTAEHQDAMADLLGRCAWLTLACEVLPRALLAELKLSPMLLGSSSAEQFLLVLAEEDVPRANDFLTRAAARNQQALRNALRLVWASTENLGAWPIARKRLDDLLLAKTVAPLAAVAELAQHFCALYQQRAIARRFVFRNFRPRPAQREKSRLVSRSTRPSDLGWRPIFLESQRTIRQRRRRHPVPAPFRYG